MPAKKLPLGNVDRQLLSNFRHKSYFDIHDLDVMLKGHGGLKKSIVKYTYYNNTAHRAQIIFYFFL
jgi:hypothetical protein